MKKLASILVIIMVLISCNQETKNHSTKDNAKSGEPKAQKTEKQLWTLDADQSSVHWTGYKTTKMVPVSGEFKSFEITGVKPYADMLATLKNARIRIKVASIFSSNEDRDSKLVEYLFGKMMQTNDIYARVEGIDVKNQQIKLNINMNNHEKVVPMNYNIDTEKGTITMEGKIDLVKDFDAGEPLYFFHTACEDKHKGEDGVSKTWSEVGIKAVIKYTNSNK